jgi:hypothetical protein
VDKILGLLKSEALTKLNLLATAVLLWIVSQPGAPTEKVLEFLPASWASIVTVVLPVLWMVIVQFAIKELKERQPETPAEPTPEA